jgi:hypothetical protein
MPMPNREDVLLHVRCWIAGASRTRELLELAGETDNPEIPDPFAELVEALEQGLAETKGMRDHTHEWAVTDDDRVLCRVCGADGDG